MPGVEREGASLESDSADVLTTGLVPNIPFLNDRSDPQRFTLFERSVRHRRAGAVQSSGNPVQHLAKAGSLSPNLKHVGQILGSCHPHPPSCLPAFWFPARRRQRLSPKTRTQVFARGKFRPAALQGGCCVQVPSLSMTGFYWEGIS